MIERGMGNKHFEKGGEPDEELKTLEDLIKKVNWKLTPELHLDDGKEHGGAVWLLLYGEVRLLAIKWVKEDIRDMPITPQTAWLLNRWKKRHNITEEELK